MRSKNFSNTATFTRPEKLTFQVSFDVKDRRGLTHFKGVAFDFSEFRDNSWHPTIPTWLADIQVGYGAPNAFDQFLVKGDVVDYILKCLCILRKMFPNGRFNINLCYRMANGSEIARYFTGEYFIMAAYARANNALVGWQVMSEHTISAYYYAIRSAASQEDFRLGNAKYSAALNNPDETEMSYQRLVEQYEASLKWLNSRSFADNQLILADQRPMVQLQFEKRFNVAGLSEFWQDLYDHTIRSNYGAKESYVLYYDGSDWDFDDDDVPSIFLSDEGYFDLGGDNHD